MSSTTIDRESAIRKVAADDELKFVSLAITCFLDFIDNAHVRLEGLADGDADAANPLLNLACKLQGVSLFLNDIADDAADLSHVRREYLWLMFRRELGRQRKEALEAAE